MSETLPPCIGHFETPIPPNSCESCKQREICRKISFEFIPRREVHDLIKQIEETLASDE